MMKAKLLAGLLGIGSTTAILAGVTLPVTPAAAIPVFDQTNYAQNLLQAARALQQINQQISQLQNEARMIAQADRNLKQLDYNVVSELTMTLKKIDLLMGQAQAIDFRTDALDAKFKKLFPGRISLILKTDTVLRDARARLDAAMSGFQQAMGVQAQVVENVEADARVLSELVARSQGASGSLQAQQATNQLLALTAKQQFQLQSMMAAQFRSESLESARRVQAETEARSATKRFLGEGKAYTPN
jgi:type IV secretion system protein TrbJ